MSPTTAETANRERIRPKEAGYFLLSPVRPPRTAITKRAPFSFEQKFSGGVLITSNLKTMKKIITLIIPILLVSCVSKETYIEKRTLTYPKGQVPHIKEMYLKNGTTVHSAERYAGVPQHPQPQVGDDEALLFPAEWSNDDLPAAEPQRPTRITLGSTKEEVSQVQGTPTTIAGCLDEEWWWYGNSYIVFNGNGTVKSWNQSGGPLKVAMN